MKEAFDLYKLIEQFGSEEKCREYLTQLRWPNEAMHCPKCSSKKITTILQSCRYNCGACYSQFSATSDTILHDTHLPLWKWFIATYLLCESRNGMSAHQIKRTLGISYQAAWYLCHRIRAAVANVEGHRLTGRVGGKQAGHGGKLKNPAMAIVIRELEGHLHLVRANEVNQSILHDIIARNVDKAVHVVMIDDSNVGNFNARQDPFTRSLPKHSIMGAWHQVSGKHLTAYLQEMVWRFNNQTNPYAFRDAMIKLIESPKFECKKLIASQSGSLKSFSWRRNPGQRKVRSRQISQNATAVRSKTQESSRRRSRRNHHLILEPDPKLPLWNRRPGRLLPRA